MGNRDGLRVALGRLYLAQCIICLISQFISCPLDLNLSPSSPHPSHRGSVTVVIDQHHVLYMGFYPLIQDISWAHSFLLGDRIRTPFCALSDWCPASIIVLHNRTHPVSEILALASINSMSPSSSHGTYYSQVMEHPNKRPIKRNEIHWDGHNPMLNDPPAK